MPAQAAQPVVVMHVEDDAAVATAVATLLRGEGYETLSARDGPQALAMLAGERPPPDVLILDCNLPGGMDGADVAQEICHTLGHVVPAIFLSGELSNATLPWLPGAPLLFASKPLDPEILLATVAAFAALGRVIRRRPAH